MTLVTPLIRPVARPARAPLVSGTAAATGELSFSGNVVNNSTITIGSRVYRYVTALAQANDVLIGASASVTISNHVAAINASAGAGSIYGNGTTIHPDVTASAAAGKMVVTAKVPGPAGNSIATTSTSVNATWGAPILQGGA